MKWVPRFRPRCGHAGRHRPWGGTRRPVQTNATDAARRHHKQAPPGPLAAPSPTQQHEHQQQKRTPACSDNTPHLNPRRHRSGWLVTELAFPQVTDSLGCWVFVIFGSPAVYRPQAQGSGSCLEHNSHSLSAWADAPTGAPVPSAAPARGTPASSGWYVAGLPKITNTQHPKEPVTCGNANSVTSQPDR